MASLGANMFDARGLWQTAPDPLAALAKAEKPKPVEVASAGPAVTGSTGIEALAYAPETPTVPAPRAKAMGAGASEAVAAEVAPETRQFAATPNTTVVAKAGPGAFTAMTSGAQSASGTNPTFNTRPFALREIWFILSFGKRVWPAADHLAMAMPETALGLSAAWGSFD